MTMNELHTKLVERPYLIKLLSQETLQTYLFWLFNNENFKALLDVVELHNELPRGQE